MPEAVGEPAIAPFGDAALLVTFGDRADPRVTAQAGAVARLLDERRSLLPALGRAVPAHATVLVPFDPLNLDARAAADLVRDAVRAMTGTSAPDAAGDAIEIPVHYGGPDGPDLEEVAERHGMSPADVVELHAGARYRVLFLGFAPGFAYLGGLPDAIATPRRPSPRERVPAGSVGIAGEQTGVYPLSMPGGWNLIGRTDAVLFDPQRAEPALLQPGAPVRFVPAR
jgi:KipI family sensor histidine kinase inhibitor